MTRRAFRLEELERQHSQSGDRLNDAQRFFLHSLDSADLRLIASQNCAAESAARCYLSREQKNRLADLAESLTALK
jgi:hypothetical protein